MALTVDLSEGHAAWVRMGVTLAPAKGVRGAAVETVAPFDQAAPAGLKPGHVITAVNGKAVKDAKSALAMINLVKGPISVQYVVSAEEAPKRRKSFPRLRLSKSFSKKSAKSQKDILAGANLAVEEATEEHLAAAEIKAAREAAATTIAEAAQRRAAAKAKADEVAAAADQVEAAADNAADAATEATAIAKEVRVAEIKRTTISVGQYVAALAVVLITYYIATSSVEPEPEPELVLKKNFNLLTFFGNLGKQRLGGK
jgi:membrane-associated protease RseP (regulator of RpoE activity)